MYVDLLGKTRYKVNLHTHTTRSDGAHDPKKVIELYKKNGYDAIALTDHWIRNSCEYADGITVLSGAEYHIGNNGENDVYHILGLGTNSDLTIDKPQSPQEIIDGIHAVGGMAVLAHPAWSLNTPEQIMKLRDIDAIEIYNSVSGVHNSRRPDSGIIVDMVAARGLYLPLVADDDTHYYDADACVAWIMAEAADSSEKAILDAVKKGNFYATQGPEVHMWTEGDEAVVRCSPVCEITFFSNCVYCDNRAVLGTNLTEARYKINDTERYLRCEVTDGNGKRAWTNILRINR